MELNKKNVLFLTRTMKLGGTENVILQLCEILKPQVNKIVVCSCGGVNVEKLQKMGIKHYMIPDIEEKSLKTFLTTYKVISKIVKKESITVIHTHHRMAAFYAQIIKYRYRVPVICSVHGEFYDKKLLTKVAYGHSQIVACGEKVRENLVDWFGLKKDRVVVLRNAVEKDERYNPIKEIEKLRSENFNCFIVGYVGRISREKGVDALVRALAKVVTKKKDIYLVIAGDGDFFNDVKSLSAGMGLNDNIVFLGYRNDPQNVIQQVDSVALCSYTEGLPLTPIEAFAHGKPMIATPVGGTVEIVKNEINGVIVSPGNIDEIASSILDLACDKEKYLKLARNAEKCYYEEFSYEIFESQVLSLYENL